MSGNKIVKTPKLAKRNMKCNNCDGTGWIWTELYQHNPPKKVDCFRCNGSGLLPDIKPTATNTVLAVSGQDIKDLIFAIGYTLNAIDVRATDPRRYEAKEKAAPECGFFSIAWYKLVSIIGIIYVLFVDNLWITPYLSTIRKSTKCYLLPLLLLA